MTRIVPVVGLTRDAALRTAWHLDESRRTLKRFKVCTCRNTLFLRPRDAGSLRRGSTRPVSSKDSKSPQRQTTSWGARSMKKCSHGQVIPVPCLVKQTRATEAEPEASAAGASCDRKRSSTRRAGPATLGINAAPNDAHKSTMFQTCRRVACEDRLGISRSKRPRIADGTPSGKRNNVVRYKRVVLPRPRELVLEECKEKVMTYLDIYHARYIPFPMRLRILFPRPGFRPARHPQGYGMGYE